MATVSFCKHERYPALEMDVSVDPTIIGGSNIASAGIIALGEPVAIARLQDDVLAWEVRHKLGSSKLAWSPRVVRVSFNLPSWDVVADFVVTWAGIENLESLVRDRSYLEAQLLGEIRGLAAQVEKLTTSVDWLRRVAIKLPDVQRSQY